MNAGAPGRRVAAAAPAAAERVDPRPARRGVTPRARRAALLGLLLALVAACGPRVSAAVADEGVVDLRGAGGPDGAIHELRGAWRLRWGAPGEAPTVSGWSEPGVDFDRAADGAPAPGRGRRGRGAYALRVLLPPRGPEDEAADPWVVAVDGNGRPFRLEVKGDDGRALAPPLQVGVVGGDRASSVASDRDLLRPLLPAPGGALNLSFETAYYDFGPRAGPSVVLLGEASALEAELTGRRQDRLLIIGVCLVMALYHLGLFLLRRGERAPLFFALLCLGIAVRQYFRFDLFEDRFLRVDAFELHAALEYGGFFLALPLFTSFLRALFPADVPRLAARAIAAVAGVACLGVALAPLGIQARVLSLFEAFTFVVLAFIAYAFGRVIWLGRDPPVTRTLAVGVGVLVLATANDILHNRGIIHTLALEHVGMFAFIFSQALVLAVVNMRARRTAEALAGELDRKNVELSRLDRLKDEFLANTSHELRTPLHGIIGLAEGLLASERAAISEAGLHQLSLIVVSGRRLAGLVGDILDFAQLRGEGVDLRPQGVDLHALVDLVIALLQPLVGERPINLHNRIDPALPEVWADEDRLQQVFYNLVGNAIKFTRAGAVEVSARVVDDLVEVTVADTGIGIDADHLQRIFGAFYQVEGSRQREFGGTGLGLAITRELVVRQGGTIRAESEVGVGSRFTFTVPRKTAARSLAAADAAGAAASRSAAGPGVDPAAELLASSSGAYTAELALALAHAQDDEPGRSRPAGDGDGDGDGPDDSLSGASVTSLGHRRSLRLRVLAVDDDPVNLTVIESQLGVAGIAVSTAPDGPTALRYLESQSYDLVLLDVMMPHVTGFEVLRQIRERHSPESLPVLLLTAQTREQDVVRGFDLGANDFITKPFSKRELLARLQAHGSQAKRNLAFGRFVPREFLELLGKDNILEVQLGDAVHRDMGVLFCDIRGFTGLSERLGVREIFRFLNSVYARIGPIIRDHGGFVDKYIGDAIMALFPGDGGDAVRAAAAIAQVIDRMELPPEMADVRLAAGIGIHRGPVMLGTIGERRRMEATVIADAVNVASRLEGLTKHLGAAILVSDDVVRALGPGERRYLRDLGDVRVKGKRQSVRVYELFEGEPEPRRAAKEAAQADFAAALGRLRKGEFAAAAAGFEAIAARDPEDQPARAHAQRARELAAAPPAAWDGVIEFSSK